MACLTVVPLQLSTPVLQNSCTYFRNKQGVIAAATNRVSLKLIRVRRPRLSVSAQKSDSAFKVFGTLWKIGRDGIEAGANLIPESVPRPLARGGVALGGFLLVSFLLKSLLSTVFFIVATVGLIYFVFIYMNKDEGPRGKPVDTERSIDETLDEARRIMEKYK